MDVVTDLRCTIRRRGGTVTNADVAAPTEPTDWSMDDAKEALWACIRALDAVGVYRLSLVEVDKAVSRQIEVVTATATLTTPALRLSSMAQVWLSEAVFQMPDSRGVNQVGQPDVRLAGLRGHAGFAPATINKNQTSRQRENRGPGGGVETSRRASGKSRNMRPRRHPATADRGRYGDKTGTNSPIGHSVTAWQRCQVVDSKCRRRESNPHGG